MLTNLIYKVFTKSIIDNTCYIFYSFSLNIFFPTLILMVGLYVSLPFGIALTCDVMTLIDELRNTGITSWSVNKIKRTVMKGLSTDLHLQPSFKNRCLHCSHIVIDWEIY